MRSDRSVLYEFVVGKANCTKMRLAIPCNLYKTHLKSPLSNLLSACVKYSCGSFFVKHM